MGAIVNRELKQRVRQISGITAHKSITKQDIKHAAKVVQNFDNRWAIWANEEEKKDEEKEASWTNFIYYYLIALKSCTKLYNFVKLF